MKAETEKTAAKQSKAVAGASPARQLKQESEAKFEDRRPEAVGQRALAGKADSSPQAGRIAQLQAMADSSAAGTVQRLGLDEEEPLQGKFATIQKQEEEEELQMKSETIQRQGPEEEELLQGKFETVQRRGAEEEEELLQGKFETVQRQGAEEEEELLEGKFETIQKQPDDEEPMQGRLETIQKQGLEEEEIQAKSALVQKKNDKSANNTGLPDTLKSGIENLSGLSLDDVKVHYNSPKPAQLQAHAFAQGSDIHMAPGQEKHLPHEAWHVVQQKQGRVKPTRQLQGRVNVNDNAGLENDADVMGAKALQQNKFVLQQKQERVKPPKKLNSNNPILQGRWKEGLPSTDQRMTDALKEKYPNAKVILWKVTETREDQTHTYKSLDEIAKKLDLTGAVVPGKQPEAPLSAIASASKEAHTKAVAEVGAKGASKPKATQKQVKKHTTVKDGGGQLIINYVWLGSDTLGSLEKFNIYSWRALGHSVSIYTHPFAGGAPHTPATLGLDQGDATIIPLNSILTADDRATGEDSPKASLGDARSILRRWLGAIPKEGKPTKEHIYNMVDLTKSYIGGTQRGIVLDMKVGPSVHIQDYVDTFNNKLISYTRGGNTAELPENQSIGTMQASEELRLKYAKEFNVRIRNLAESDHNQSWFNQITGYHGQSYQATQQWLDVATKNPSGAVLADSEFPVGEPGAVGHGPFRVFKRASDQSNKSGVKTKPSEVRFLAQDVFKKELSVGNVDETFLGKAKAAMELLPSEK